ncbi:DUF3320 domain-containing protein [Bosea sp. 117]|uniref:DUF3320 domain-containing protein n=1 Tax=Bosea sp. 117 TaxID=1125973 RepID=UPI000494A9DD|nr:DUF3320 domain-containing protein [Bosea sp. 117]
MDWDIGGAPLAGDGVEARAVEIRADMAASFTFASFQNAVPVLRSIAIANPTDRHLESCRLELVANPAFLRPKVWAVDRIVPGDTLNLADRRVDLDAAYLAGLDEAERGEVTLRLTAKDAVVAERHMSVRLLARDEWGGVGDMAQLLPAFVMPNDPAVAGLLRAAAERLAAHGHPSGMDGYQSNSPQRAFLLAASLYSAVAGLGLHYAEPPASFEQRGQKVRRPSVVAGDRLATCLDGAVLFAAALEAAGLHPVLLLFRGHAAAGVWLTPRSFSNAIETDLMEVRKALASRELIVFETTGVTHRPPIVFDHAQSLLSPRLEDAEAHNFVAAVDVRRARGSGITPLASHEALRTGTMAEADGDGPVDLPLPPAPHLSEMPAALTEVKPTTAAGRIDRWQKKLLDLTLRNRLLNFPESKKTIPFLCTAVAFLEDRLSDGAAVRLISLPEQNPLGERDASLYRETRGRDLDRGFAAEALARDELPSTLDAKKLEARLVELHRQVRNDMAEGGANTLFLAVGFLRWKKAPTDERSYRAPLLLAPVKLDRRSATSQFFLRFHEDEPRFNATLLQFLERDFALALPQFAGELPRDENGVDVQRLIGAMRHAVRDVPGMEVLDETALSTFSFAKFLMWKDLTERTDALRENRVVRHLIDTPEQAFETDHAAVTEECEIDRRFAPADIISLLPADSSQIAASMAAASGCDFVIVGPPGTGKSQTIANMIANCLAVGKTVLFVAEKTAALNVVYRRLREHGLGDHCLELHSNKADRKHFLTQLKRSWEHGGQRSASDWVLVNEKLRIRRDALNAYVEALHRRHRNGLTAYEAMGMAAQGEGRHAPALSWTSLDAHDGAARQGLEEMAATIGRAFAATERRPALHLVTAPEWSSAWQERLLAAANDVRGHAVGLGKALATFLGRIGLPPAADAPLPEMERLAVLAESLCSTAGRDHRITFDPEFGRLREALSQLDRAIVAYRTAESRLTARFARDTVPRVPVEQLEQDWREATAAIWPKSWLARRRVRKLLQSHATSGMPDPETDLPLLRTMQESRSAVEASSLAGKPIGFSGLDTDVAAVSEHISSAASLRESLLHLGCAADELRSVVAAIAPILAEGGSNDPVRQAARDYLAALRTFRAGAGLFAEIAGSDPLASTAARPLTDLASAAAELVEARGLLRGWTDWCGTRQTAEAHGLGALIADLESGAVRPDGAEAAFRLAYARWWLPPTLDAEPVLRDFQRFRHEHAIREFREIDDLVRTQATQRVIAAIAHGLPGVQSVPRNSELGLLRHQMELQRPSRSIREMIGTLPGSFAKLAPCMLMSPLSIAQYLPPNQALFDVVIFDEASQITTWDAVGAIARGRQTVIVGDPKQLPPTNFFGRNEEDEAIEEHERDLESILDEAKAAGIPVRDLRWHYRSRNESLIAFSNAHYYQNRLITFPSPAVEDRAVRLRHVPDGIYDRGKSRTNRIEAGKVAEETAARLRGWLKLKENERPTLGIITFNDQQRSLIQDLLDEARRAEPALEWFFAEERIEPLIVKNLENVQGDERDVVLFSTTFAADAAGKRSMDFGALNREGGERRLNVAVTRARQELVVFSGFTADLIDTDRTKAVGVQHLKTFLDFAERGAIALPAQDEGSVGAPDSPFEEAVIAALDRLGWQTVSQVGISGFRVDIGVKHPDRAGAYLAGVECDGATYHRAATARDRDKVREQVLRGLGWNIVRVWSTDWWFDSQGATRRLHQALDDLLAASRQQTADESETAPAHWDMGHQVEPADETLAAEADADDSSGSPPMAGLPEDVVPLEPALPERIASLGARSAPPHIVAPQSPLGHSIASSEVIGNAGEATGASVDGLGYRMTDLSGIRAEPERFFDIAYHGTLSAMVEAIIDCEAPLREDLLLQKIARAHGWLRTGGRIRERIMLHLKNVDRTQESSGVFLWKRGTVAEIIAYRAPSDSEARRQIAEIPLAELAQIVMQNRHFLDWDDPPLAFARLLGVERLAASSRERLAEAVARAVQHASAV